MPAPARALTFWLPTLLWLLLLAWFSTDTFSAEHTGGILLRIIHAVYGPVSQPAFQEIHFYVRKSAHFLAYGMLSAFAFFSWRATLASAVRWSLRWSVLALGLTLLAASLDEFHQSFVASRGSSWHDVALDMTGAFVFQIAIAAWLSVRKRRA
ncbi:MAG TPA: VanZ family protein [Candidatus Angelobacter sp.]